MTSSILVGGSSENTPEGKGAPTPWNRNSSNEIYNLYVQKRRRRGASPDHRGIPLKHTPERRCEAGEKKRQHLSAGFLLREGYLVKSTKWGRSGKISVVQRKRPISRLIEGGKSQAE